MFGVDGVFGVVEQGGLADAGLAAQDQGPAGPARGVGEEPMDDLEFS
ncbi:hypothetical protein [Spirillospora sp. NPDC047279]